MYMWHGKHYVGAAHGIAGILYMLLQVNHIKTPCFHTEICGWNYIPNDIFNRQGHAKLYSQVLQILKEALSFC